MVMKHMITLLLIISVSHGVQESERYLEAPKVTGVSLIKPEGLYVQWWPVNQRENNPVIGYKIRIWEIPESSESQIELVDAERYPGLVKNEEPSQIFTMNNTNPVTREEIVRSTNNGLISYTVNKLSYNKLYEVRVLAFKADVDGPLSPPVRIKTITGSGYEVVIKRTMTGCQVTVPSEVQYEYDPYPYEYNSYF